MAVYCAGCRASCPGGHVWQVVPLRKRPVSHCWHDCRLAATTCPAGHGMHSVAFCPGWNVLPGHGRHAVAAGLRLKVPGPHGMTAACPLSGW
jgi:hypothetical protein